MSSSTPLQDSSDSDAPVILGWREWVSLPDLGIPAIKAKVDTGARTSAIDAFDLKRFKDDNGAECIEFSIHPLQRDYTVLRRCKAPLIDIRSVTDSGGHTEERFFVQTSLQVGQSLRVIELTLANRTNMLFKMLLGRTSLVPDIMVNPHLSYTCGRLKPRALYSDVEEATGEH